MEERQDATVIGVDTGGTFTDVFTADGRVVKVPSVPADPSRAILAGLRAVGVRSGDRVGHGTTVATNAVLEGKVARTALLTTAGFEDVLALRRQNRPSLYDLYARWPDPPVPSSLRLGITERLDPQGNILQPLDRNQARGAIAGLSAVDVEAVAVCLLFAYVAPAHEEALAGLLARLLPGVPVSLSHQVAPRIGEYERTSTTVINAALLPVMQRYLAALIRDAGELGVAELHVMHSNGGLLPADTARELPVQTVLSGPAAGVVGARDLARRAGHDRIITFDMGGTSTDVAVVPGQIGETVEGAIAGFPLLLPMISIETVGAGGGSIARLDAVGGLHVGPESAGSDPGPAAYGRGDRPTVTDANLILGRLSPAGLLGGDLALDPARARAALVTLAGPLGLSVEGVAWAVVRLANSSMERAVRAVTLQRGHDPRTFTLFPFGGAGPLHAAELADGLGIDRILVPPHPGVMAALGLTVPDLQRDFARTLLRPLDRGALGEAAALLDRLEDEARALLGKEVLFGQPQFARALDVRYAGQTFDLRVPFDPDVALVREAFLARYADRYGRARADLPLELVTVNLRAVLPRLSPPRLVPAWPEAERPPGRRAVWFGSATGVTGVASVDTSVLWRPSLAAGNRVRGPAVLEQYDSTVLIPPDWSAMVDERFNVVMERA